MIRLIKKQFKIINPMDFEENSILVQLYLIWEDKYFWINGVRRRINWTIQHGVPGLTAFNSKQWAEEQKQDLILRGIW